MELKEFKLPTGKVAYLKPELTAGDYDDVMSVYYESMDIKVDKDKKDVSDFNVDPGKLLIKSKYRLLSVAIVKIKNEKGEIDETITEEYLRNMKREEIEALHNEANDIYEMSVVSPKDKKKL